MQVDAQASTSRVPFGNDAKVPARTASVNNSPTNAGKAALKGKGRSWDAVLKSGAAGGVAACIAKTSVGELTWLSCLSSG